MKITIAIVFLLAVLVCQGQDYSLFHSKIKSFFDYSTLPDSAQRAKKINELWTSLQTAHQIPIIAEDSVAFLYRGNARTVEWTGDFNAWGYLKNVDNKGKLIPGTDVWMFKAGFPKDTRFDYKILIDGHRQIVDPENEHQQWSGVGGGSLNSELRMPNWKEDPVLQVRKDIPHGTVMEEILFSSKTLGYQITYSVYLPANYNTLGKISSLYVTDGYEYILPRLGNMVTILDNLLADKKIKPIVAIFVDHREPINRSNNKRMEELAMNPKYLEFFTKEFIPFIESNYHVDSSYTTRAIMGSSMGGLSAAYFAFAQPGIFGMAGIQSPAFWVRPQIYAICNNPEHPVKVSMTSGLISDASEGSRKMKEILQTNACQYHYLEVNDGHSWGNWRNLIDDVLVDLFGN